MRMKRKMSITRVIAVFGLVAISVSAFAFIEDKPEGAQFHPEQSQGQVTEQQQHQGTQGVVGDVPTRTSPRYNSRSSKSGEGADILADASAQLAAKTLVEAEEQLQAENAGRFKWAWWAIGMLMLGLGVFLGFKSYADKTVPEQKRKRRSNW